MRVEPLAAAPPAPGELHVWRLSLDVAAPRLRRLEATLSDDERVRARRLRRRLDRERFASGRGALREILAGYLDAAPAALRFRDAGHGKPALGGELEFSLSRSGGLGLLAVSREAIGVDVEQVQERFPWESIAAGFLTAREARSLASLAPAQRTAGFFSCWTRKEAVLKAVGDGLSMGLDDFEVSGAAPVEVVAARGRSWWVRGFEPAPGYVAAVAAEAPVALAFHRWEK